MFTVKNIQAIRTEKLKNRDDKVPRSQDLLSLCTMNEFSVQRELIKLTGGINSGILLSRLTQIHEEKRILYGGQRWIARTKAEWFEDIGLTTGMFDRALLQLKARELVLTRKSNIDGRVLLLVRENKPVIEYELNRLHGHGTVK